MILKTVSFPLATFSEEFPASSLSSLLVFRRKLMLLRLTISNLLREKILYNKCKKLQQCLSSLPWRLLFIFQNPTYRRCDNPCIGKILIWLKSGKSKLLAGTRLKVTFTKTANRRPLNLLKDWNIIITAKKKRKIRQTFHLPFIT